MYVLRELLSFVPSVTNEHKEHLVFFMPSSSVCLIYRLTEGSLALSYKSFKDFVLRLASDN